MTAIVVNYRTPDLAIQCLAALDGERHAGVALDVVLVDGGSADGSADRLRLHLDAMPDSGWIELLPLAFNGGFGWANNQAIRRVLQRPAPPDFVYLVNPDAVVEPLALVQLVQALHDEPRAAAAGSLLLSDDGRPLGSAFRFPTVASEFVRGANTPLVGRLLRTPPPVIDADAPVTADWVTGASVLLRAKALRQCGLFDEGFFLYFEEVELMHRLHRAGWLSLHVPASRVRHQGGAATGVADGASAQPRLPDYWFRSRRRFFARVHGPVQARMASLAWMAGFGLWRLRELIGLGRDHAHAPGEWRDLWRNGVAPTALDRRSAVAQWDEPIDRLPLWATEA